MKAALSLAFAGLVCVAGCKKPPVPEPAKPTAQVQQHEHAMPAMPATTAEWANGAQLYESLGKFHRKISTASPEAQSYFDQGMRLLWAFNHDESTRSFAKAAQIDPQCAICYWGVALTVGPNYNLPMMAAPRAKVAAEAEGLAQKNAEHASEVEQALIAALARRYPNAEPLDPTNMAPVMTAYADAMREVAKKYPDDFDVQTLFAESMMNLNAWKLWTLDGKPAPGTLEVVATLERVLKKDPTHPGANHYYVHTVEASPTPQKGVASAERLVGMMPAAGHLEHMPAHIMQRVGRYEEAAEANRKGATADETYMTQTRPLDYYSMYAGHNYQFLAYSAAMEGRKAETVKAGQDSRRVMPVEMLPMMPGTDWFMMAEYAGLIRFGLWDEMLKAPAPDQNLHALYGGYLYAKGMAQAASGKTDEARKTLQDLDSYAAKLPPDTPAGFNTAHDVLNLASDVVKARIASSEKKTDEALTLLRQAVAKEDKLAYNEPADWVFPVRHLLGAQLLAAGQAKEAEAVYREDLKRHPNNGWSLYGLAASLRAQKKPGAEKVDREFRKAWEKSDIQLTASAF